MVKKKVLIIEKGNCHFELLPSWAYYFSTCGFDVDIYLIPKNKSRGIINVITDLKLNCNIVHTIQLNIYQIIINNTHYPHEQLKYFKKDVKRKVGSVTHIVKPFRSTNINDPKHTVITLSKHTHNLAKKYVNNSIYLYPIFFFPFKKLPVRNVKKKKIFVVQGAFTAKRRNYNALMKLVEDLNDRNDYVIKLLGSGGNMIGRIKKRLQSYISNGKVKILNGLNYARYFDELKKSHFILPLVDHGSVSGEYFKNKISSSIMMGVGNVLPSICDVNTSTLYGFRNNEDCFTYNNYDEFKQSFLKALDINQKTYDKMMNNIYKIRKDWIQTSKTNLKSRFK